MSQFGDRSAPHVILLRYMYSYEVIVVSETNANHEIYMKNVFWEEQIKIRVAATRIGLYSEATKNLILKGLCHKI
jgi:hypothetical protein